MGKRATLSTRPHLDKTTIHLAVPKETTVYVVCWEVRDGYTGSSGYHWSTMKDKALRLFMEMTAPDLVVSEVFRTMTFAIDVPTGLDNFAIAHMIEDLHDCWHELSSLTNA